MLHDLYHCIFSQIQEALILEENLNAAILLGLDMVLEVDGIAQHRRVQRLLPFVPKPHLTLDGRDGAYELATCPP